MGVCQSQEDKIEHDKSKAIDKEITASKNINNKTIKLLLLGAGECGKSTVLKQMRILHNKGFSATELQQQKGVVYNNTIHAMLEILKNMQHEQMVLANEQLEPQIRVLNEVVKQSTESEPFTDELRTAIKELWSDVNVQKFYESFRLKYHLHESSKFFLDSVDRICEAGYLPTEQDILLTRIKTTGIVEVVFEIKGANFRVFDVGGQRSERKKWIHCFEDVNAIIFIVAISEYDEVLREDEHTNRLLEALRLYDQITNSRWFVKTSMIIFFNKRDLFEEKIDRVSIKTAFPEYDGPQSCIESIEYLRQKFLSVTNNTAKQVFIHETCATDSNQVQQILDSVISMIIRQNLYKTGLY